MNKIIIRAPFVLLIVLSISVGCEESYKPIDYKKMEAEETAILDEFYNTSGAAWDSMLIAANNDTIDDRTTTGLMYLERVKGTGDSVLIGKQVGVRYSFYGLLLNDDDEPTLYLMESNHNSEAPLKFTVGSAPDDVFRGVDLGVRKMRNKGESTFIMPSSISTGRSYLTVIADVELVFVQLD